ncbi:MAG: hypothetical protein RIQ79_1950 [Verrucomicrobiota bacterium]
MHSPLKTAQKAFTLIELLTVIAIIGILAAIIIPVVGKVRNTAQSARCISNLRQIGQEIVLFANDNRGQLPNLSGLTNSAVLDPRIVDRAGGQLAYRLWPYYSSIPLNTGIVTPRNVNVHEMFICPSMENLVRPKITNGPYPTSAGDQSANSAQSYIINDVQRYTEGSVRYTVFGYQGSPSFNINTIESKLKIPNEAVTLSRIWTIQDGDRTLTDGAASRSGQMSFIAEQPSHVSSRNRGYLDGSVRKLSLKESTES